jgi:hypothetical protein
MHLRTFESLMMSGRPRILMASLVVLSVALSAAAYASIPGAHQASAENASEVTAVVTSSGFSSTFTQTAGVAVVYSSCSGSTETYGNMTWITSPCVSYGFPSAPLKNTTLDSRQVLPFIKTAYEYHLVYFGYSKTDSNVMYAILNVTGTQVVTGNWTSGYHVDYVGDKLLNVTILQVVASRYEVSHIISYALPDRNESIAYTSQQVQAIQVALNNSKVQSLMADPPYYAEFVGTSGNSTVAGTYFVQLYQVDGTGVVGAFVNPRLSAVMGSYSEQRVSGECWPDGLVITDPWDAPGFSGCGA